MRVLSLGAGVQSSTLLLMAVHGELQIDRAIFADTQWEPREVYDWLGGLVLAAGHAGIPVETVTAGNLRDDALAASRRSASMPLHVLNADGSPGMIRRQCTNEYKIRPIQRRLRELGVTRKQPAAMLIGISLDEAQRMKPSRVQYVEHEYPLIDRRMTRQACLVWLERHGYPQPPKSACIGCPFMDNGRWRALRDNSPDEWADAVDFDAAVRRMTRIDGDVFLHRSLVPLPMVDLSTQQDAGQLDMFGAECEGMCGV
jgi:hypothetical protein